MVSKNSSTAITLQERKKYLINETTYLYKRVARAPKGKLCIYNVTPSYHKLYSEAELDENNKLRTRKFLNTRTEENLTLIDKLVRKKLDMLRIHDDLNELRLIDFALRHTGDVPTEVHKFLQKYPFLKDFSGAMDEAAIFEENDAETADIINYVANELAKRLQEKEEEAGHAEGSADTHFSDSDH